MSGKRKEAIVGLSWKKHAILKPPSEEELALMEPDELLELHETYHEAIRCAEEDPLEYGFHLDHWRDFERLLWEDKELLVLGGNRCLGGEQEIYDPVLKSYRRVDSIGGDFHVNAWDEESGRVVVAKALAPFAKHRQGIYRTVLSDGTAFYSSESHRVLGVGKYVSVGELVSERLPCELVSADDIFDSGQISGYSGGLPVSIWDIYPSASLLDVDRLLRIVGGLKCDYSVCLHQCDGRPHLLSGSDLGVSPSLADVREYISCVFERWGDLGCKSQYIRFYLRPCRLSILDVLRRSAGRFAGILSRVFCKPCKSVLGLCEHRGILRDHLQSAAEFYRQSQSIGEFDELGIQFCYVRPYGDGKAYGVPVKSDYLRKDVVWDFEVPKYHNYLIGRSVHHNSSKTRSAAEAVVRAAIGNKQAHIICFAQDAVASIRVQQKAVYECLPSKLKQTIRSETGYIKYSIKNGFTGESLIIPETKSIIEFRTYTQFQNNPGKFEGLELGSFDCTYANIGVWMDEYLQGPDLVDTMRFRLATRDASILITFTPINGITEFVGGYIKGAETIKRRPAALLGGEELPYIQRSVTRNASIIYFHSDMNPFGGYDRLAKDLKGRPREEILTRAYGVPVKMMAGLFPLFRRSINVVPRGTIDEILSNKTNVTLYQGIDPAPNKRWFVLWVAVTREGDWYVYREWPDKSYGNWGEIGMNNKSRLGAAAKPDGKGIRDYVDLFRMEEGDEEIYERIIDPRMGASPKQIEEGSTTIIDQLDDHGIHTIQSLGTGGNEQEITNGITMLNGLMSFNIEKEIDSVNRPRFYISEDCENTIDAILNYTGAEGRNEAWKDPIDILRYFAMSEIGHMEKFEIKRIETRKRGGY